MNIALAGYGQEGRASYDYWNRGENSLTIADERDQIDGLPSGVSTILGADAFSELGEFDLIIRSPSVNPKKLPYGNKVWSATNEFFATCPAPIIGVTGTKGKGTTSSFIAEMLRAAGRTVHLVGNIGTPALAELPNIKTDDIVVFELSSFQLWDTKKSPHIAVVLGIEPDHLDVHDSMEDYVAAKANIVRSQTEADVAIYNKNNQISSKISQSSRGKKIEYPFAIDDLKSSLQIPGPHNVENASAAIAAVRELDVSDETIRQGLSGFDGLPHRIKFVREIDGVRYYDDSYSSAPSATIAAIKSFNEPKVVIMGGYDRGLSYDDLAREVTTCLSVRAVILIGQTRQKLHDALVRAGYPSPAIDMQETQDFSAIVAAAHQRANAGSVVVLSPGAPSFDMFKNFEARGQQFIELVGAL